MGGRESGSDDIVVTRVAWNGFAEVELMFDMEVRFATHCALAGGVPAVAASRTRLVQPAGLYACIIDLPSPIF
jgi:hypothetical protein